MAEVKTLALDEIRPNPSKLREVLVDSEGFQGLVESVKDVGILNAISVRLKVDAETGEQFYELVDGAHRFTAATYAGLNEINVTVLDIDGEGPEADSQVYAAQLMANVHKIETKPVQYAHNLLRISTLNPMMTEAQLAAKINKSATWVRQQLKLNRIKDPKIQSLIDDGKIPVLSAYSLSSLPEEEQANMVDSAMVDDVKTFIAAVEARKKALKEAARTGQEASSPEFQPRPRLRGMKELDSLRQDSGLITQLLNECNAASNEEAVMAALDYMRHMDSGTLSKEQADWETKQNLKESKRLEKQQLAAKKKADAAAIKAAQLAEEAASIGAQAQLDVQG